MDRLESVALDHRLTVTLHRSLFAPLLRLFAHFDALDGDDDPVEVKPRYELLHPDDHFDMPDWSAAFNDRLCLEMLYGPAV